MASKRRRDAMTASENSQPSKRQRNQTSISSNSKNRDDPGTTDPNYGQRCVFPMDASTVPSDEDLEFEDEADALAYLKSVRLEASEIPHVIAATRAGPQLPPQLAASSGHPYYHEDDDDEPADRTIYENGVGDTRGYYEDGAYIAAMHEDGDSDGQGAVAAADTVREAYFASLMEQFASLRMQLWQEPPEEVVAALPRDQRPEVKPLGHRSSTFKVWHRRLTTTDPWPAQVAAMDKVEVLRLLRIVVGGRLLKRGSDLRERTSRWLWALLARLPERGELDHADVATIRDLGKRAVLMMASMAEVEALREQAELDEGGEDSEVGDMNGVEDMELDELEEQGEESGGFGDKEEEDGDDDDNDGGLGDGDRTLDGEAVVQQGNTEEVRAGAEVEVDDEDREDGEVVDEATPAARGADADIAAAKARLLARINGIEAEEAPAQSSEQETASSPPPPPPPDAARAQMNLRATLTMILTVAGEFYGQRDLLEFRDPFGSGL